MKFALFLVSYRNEPFLYRCLESIKPQLSSMDPCDSLEITVINNFGELKLPDEFSFAKVMNNSARPDFSTGHLSRNWNQCIMHGFENVISPNNDVVIAAQHDTMFKPNFLVNIKEHLKRYNYMTFGAGDELQIITPESVKTIGMFDERFCGIGYQEADYFLRALILNKDKSSINDYTHKRIHNSVENNVIENVICGTYRNDAYTIESIKFHEISFRMLKQKWDGFVVFSGRIYPMEHWDKYVDSLTRVPKQYMMYPYFESYLYDLDHKYF